MEMHRSYKSHAASHWSQSAAGEGLLSTWRPRNQEPSQKTSSLPQLNTEAANLSLSSGGAAPLIGTKTLLSHQHLKPDCLPSTAI